MPPSGDDTSQERTLPATQKKIDEAKDKGEFARSREVSTVAVFTLTLLFFWLGQDYIVRQILHAGGTFLRFDALMDLSVGNAPNLMAFIALIMLPILLPVFALVFFSTLVASVGQTGIRFRKDPFEAKWDKLSPAAGFKRLFSVRQVAEGVKSILKLLIFGYVGYVTIKGSLPAIARLSENTPAQALQVMTGIALKLAFRACALLILFAASDYWFQRWQYYKKLRMSHQEAKEEQKQSEGDPVMRARIRALQMEIARRRMMADVPESDVVIVNPTHYAVALKYDPEKSAAPIVVAKGQNYVAKKIREVAEEAGVPWVENPPVARALYRQVKIGQAIPSGLFKAVSEILRSIWEVEYIRAVWERAQRRDRDLAKAG